MKTPATLTLLFILLTAPLLRAADSRPNFLFIYADDQRYDALGVAQQPLLAPIVKNPAESVQIGNDLGTVALGKKKLPPFRGLIESVRIRRGALEATPPEG